MVYPPAENEFEIKVLLFASLKDAAGVDQIQVRLSISNGEPVTVSEFLTQCGQQFPSLVAWLPYVKVAVNCSYANSQHPIHSGDEIALLPPVSGG